MFRGQDKRAAEWEAAGYVSLAVDEDGDIDAAPSDDTDDADDADDAPFDDDDDEENLTCQFGDASKPVAVPASDGALVLVSVDNSGSWGRGGFFTAVDTNISPAVGEAYELAGDMSDLKLGDVHIVTISPALKVALMVTQTRKRSSNEVSGVQDGALLTCLRKVASVAKAERFAVHTPRLGAGLPGFNWHVH